MPSIELEVGKGYISRCCEYVRITDGDKRDSDYPFFCGSDGRVYNPDGRLVVSQEDDLHPHHLISEAVVITKWLYDDLVHTQPKRVRRNTLIMAVLMVIATAMSVTSMYISHAYCDRVVSHFNQK